MSIQSEINRIKGNVSAAFSAIGDKGGTVPVSKVIGNLAAAISSIPLGVTVQEKAGTFTTSGGSATVNCGFQPDLVFIQQGRSYDYNNESWPISASLAFAQASSDKIYTTLWNNDDDITDFFAKRTSNGFTLEAVKYDGSWNSASYNGSFSYIAVKFT